MIWARPSGRVVPGPAYPRFGSLRVASGAAIREETQRKLGGRQDTNRFVVKKLMDSNSHSGQTTSSGWRP
jgi:hypothetical protein